MKKRKRLIKLNDEVLNRQRTDGFNYFNDNILSFGFDETIPVLERIKFIDIVLMNYIEHCGRYLLTDGPWNYYLNSTDISVLSDTITRVMYQFESIPPTTEPITLSDISKSDSDIPVIITKNKMDIKYISKSNIRNHVIDGINYVPFMYIRDLSIQYDIEEAGDWSEEYLESQLEKMKKLYTPNCIVWINPAIELQKLMSIREYILSKNLFPLFITIDLLNYVNHKVLKEVSNLKYKNQYPQADNIDYFIREEFCYVYRVPYKSFDNILKFYYEASNHPDVESIYMTIYRTKPDMDLINTLIQATHNDKKVNLYIELKARGDEINNLELINRLKKECKLENLNIYSSLKGVKVHSKIGLVVMKDGTTIGHCATGNFNEVTSKIYKDTHLITNDESITDNIRKYFMILGAKAPIDRIQLKEILRDEIREEISKGADGRIILICNHIADTEIEDLLDLARCRGCKVHISPRTTFGLSSKEFRGGRFLEHERFYIFGKGKSIRMYLSSSDILFRNIYKRLEFTFKLPSYVNMDPFFEN